MSGEVERSKGKARFLAAQPCADRYGDGRTGDAETDRSGVHKEGHSLVSNAGYGLKAWGGKECMAEHGQPSRMGSCGRRRNVRGRRRSPEEGGEAGRGKSMHACSVRRYS